jgi:hypothetical protein
MGKDLGEFRESRERLNDAIHAAGNLNINRFFALDARVYEAGALDTRTKEMMGLVASMVLEAFSVALVVGGSIVIPHLRRAVATLEELSSK